MKNSGKGALLGATFALIGYGCIALLVCLMVGGEALPLVFITAAIASPIPIIVGAIVGDLAGRKGAGRAMGLNLLVGGSLPAVAILVVMLFFGAQDQARRSAYRAESESALKVATDTGFPFPPNVNFGMTGQMWTDEELSKIIAFYDRETSPGWERKPKGKGIVYVRASKSNGMFDKIWVTTEYSHTSIFFGSYSKEDMRLASAGAFVAELTSKRWKEALEWCDPALKSKLTPTALKDKIYEMRISSGAYRRIQFYGGRTAPYAVNVQRDMGNNMFRTGEIGFEMTDDLIPLVKQIEVVRD